MNDRQEIAELLKSIIERNDKRTDEILTLLRKSLRAIELQSDILRFQGLENRTVEFLYEEKLIRLFVPYGDYDVVQRAIMRGHSFYEINILRRLRGLTDLSGKTVLDIGANIGNHTVFFSKVCGAKKCIAFEPIPHLAAIARKNIEINELLNAEVRNTALSDRSERFSVAGFVPHNLGKTSFASQQSGSIPAAKLDDLDLGVVDFIKIDVEGNANRVLEGAAETITASSPEIMIELFADELGAAKGFLESHGYKLIADLGAGNYFFRV